MRNLTFPQWLKATLVIFWLAVLSLALPKEPIDPWGLISARKITQLVLVMVTIQTLGGALSRKIGSRAGSFISGFMGGIFSSTAVTAQIARASRSLSDDENRVAALSLLGAILAQLSLALVIVLVSLDGHFPQAFALLLSPILATALLTIIRSKKVKVETPPPEPKDPLGELVEIAKLSLIIVAFLALSKWAQTQFGDTGLYVLTFLVSLFEVHGSIIANLQLHQQSTELGNASFNILSELITLGLIASLVSKLAIVLTIGNRYMRIRMTLWAAILGASMIGGYFLSKVLFDA